MEITKTRDELIRLAADKLQIVGTGQVLEAEYATKIDSQIDPLINQLAADGICQVANPEYIPSEWFDALGGLLANVSGSIAGVSYDPSIKAFYEAQLRRVTASSPSYAILSVEYF